MIHGVGKIPPQLLRPVEMVLPKQAKAIFKKKNALFSLQFHAAYETQAS